MKRQVLELFNSTTENIFPANFKVLNPGVLAKSVKLYKGLFAS